MNTNESVATMLNIIGSLGGVSFIIISLSGWIGKIWASRILENEKNSLSKDLENFKTTNQSFLNAINSSSSLYLDAQKVYATERISAIKSLWSDLMELRDKKPSAIIYLDFLRFEEYGQIYQNEKVDFFDDELSPNNMIKLLKKDTEKLRPFIDEHSYILFFTYRAIIGRLAIYLMNIRTNGAPQQPWQLDSGIVSILKTVFNEEQIIDIQQKPWSTTDLFEKIEFSLVEHLRELSSGSDLSKKSLNNMMQLNEHAAIIRSFEIKQKENRS